MKFRTCVELVTNFQLLKHESIIGKKGKSFDSMTLCLNKISCY